MTAIYIDGVHEFDYIKNGDVHALYHSFGEQWSEDSKGELAFSIEEDGNGLILPSKMKRLDYCTARYISIILKLALEEVRYEVATFKSF